MRQKNYSPYILRNRYVSIALSALFLFAVYGPEDVSSYPNWVIQFSGFVSEKIPLISGFVAKSNFKTVTQIYMSFSIMLLPLHLIFGYQELLLSTDKNWHKPLWQINSWWGTVKRFIMTIVISGISIGTLAINGGYDFNLLPINSSRLALGFGGWIFAGGIQGMGSAWVICSIIAIYRFLKRKV